MATTSNKIRPYDATVYKSALQVNNRTRIFLSLFHTNDLNERPS